MFAIIHLLATFIADLFKPPRRLEVENLFLVRSAGRRDVGDERIVRCTAYAFAKTIEESRGDANPKPDGIFGKDNRYFEGLTELAVPCMPLPVMAALALATRQRNGNGRPA